MDSRTVLKNHKELQVCHKIPVTHCLLFASFLLLLSVFSCHRPADEFKYPYGKGPFPYILKGVKGAAWKSGTQLVISDVDCDRRDEFLYLAPAINIRNYIVLWDEEVGIASWQLNSQNELLKPFCANLDQEGNLEVIVPEKIGGSLFLNIYTSEGRQLQRFLACEGVDRNNSGEWDGKFVGMVAVDLNGDGNQEIVAALASYNDLYPRGVWAYDWKEGKNIWRFETGTQMVDIVSADLDGDGFPEIICSTGAPGNTSVANGTDDYHSYIIVLDKNGQRLWQKEIGGMFSRIDISLADIDLDGELDIVALQINGSPQTEEGSKIIILDGRTRMSKGERTFYQRVNENFDIKDINNDGQLEIILLCDNRRLLVLNSQLEIIIEYNDPQKSKSLHMLVEDLNNDGIYESILSVSKGKTVVFDNTLEKVLAVFDDGGGLLSVSTNPGQPKRLALMCPDNLYFLDMERNPGYYASFWPYIFSGLIGALAILLIFYLREKLSKSLSRLEPGFLDAIPVGLIAFDKKETVSLCNSHVGRILDKDATRMKGKKLRDAFQEPHMRDLLDLIVNAVEKSGRASNQFQISMNSETKEIFYSIAPLLSKSGKKIGTLLILEDITEFTQSRRAAAWAAMAQRLAHEIKNPLSTVMLTLQRLQMEYQRKNKEEASVYDTYTDSILEEVGRLRTVSDGFMKFASLKPPNLVPADVNDILKTILDKYAQGVPENIKLKSVFTENLPLVRIDEEQFHTLVMNLLENAMNAMADGGTLTVSTHFVQKLPQDGIGSTKDFVTVEIADTGIGISQEYIEKLFDPFFSISEGGTGLGMAIVKKILEDHNGHIDVQSRLGIGTTMTIELPV